MPMPNENHIASFPALEHPQVGLPTSRPTMPSNNRASTRSSPKPSPLATAAPSNPRISPAHSPNPSPASSPTSDLQLQISQLRAQLSKLQSKVSSLEHKSNKPQVPSTPFRRVFDVASKDPHSALSVLTKSASGTSPSILVDVAKLCLHAPVGKVGCRRALRLLAVLLCDMALSRKPNLPEALCVKGEALLPYIHYGKNDARTPRSVLQEAFALFDLACKQGSTLATFLKGRWLLSMEPLHKDSTQTLLGASLVKAAAQANCSRALVFLAHRYEYPELDRTACFAADLPKGKMMREKFILDFYKRAADCGDADALNDIGTSYAEGYGGLEMDFDSAVDYYVRAIEAGSLHAYDNLGTHYETGMGGKYPDRVSNEKAIFYYRRGVQQRCPKCAYNMAAAYEEGMSNILPRNSKKAEKYYRYSLRLADDGNDAATGSKSLRDLVSLYITRIKLNEPDSECAKQAWRRLKQYVHNEKMIQSIMSKVNKAIAAAAKSKPRALTELIGEVNSKVVSRHVKKLDQKVKTPSATPKDLELLRHVLGIPPKADENEEVEKVGKKRTRSVSKKETTAAVPKRRKSLGRKNA